MAQESKEYDYKKLGLRVGIEIHQQLDTNGKLFCRCPNELQRRDPDFRLLRTFRPVLGEEGKFDNAMLLEFKKKTLVEYEGYHDCNCTYEIDETPPFKCDEESLNIALEIALLLDLNIVDELHICRKNYVDGSVPAGFQRTMIVGVDGKLELNKDKEIGIEILCLEEDACKRVDQKGKKVIFRLDRLGIPLVEIATAPDLNTPEEARLGARRVGMLLRGTGKVKKQLGATRQDINVSIREGGRIEIKGVQKLDWIPPLVKNEVKRQLALVHIKKQLEERGLSPEDFDQNPTDVTTILKKTKCNFVNKGIKKKQKVWALKMPKMSGLWGYEVQENRRFGTEVANKLGVITGLKGLIHSDENLDKYKFSKQEIQKIRDKLKCDTEDAFTMVMGNKSRLKDAVDIIITRVKAAFDGVPPETRKALENGNNEFLRDLHGGARLYPDTDSREIMITNERIEKTKETLPEYPWILIDKYSKKYKLDLNTFEELLLGGDLPLFDKIMENYSGKPMLVATTMLELTKSLRRDGYDIENISNENFVSIFSKIESGEIAKEALESVFQFLAENADKNVDDAIKNLGLESMKKSDLEELVSSIVPGFADLIKERGMGAMGPIMGRVMQDVRGKIDGKIVSQVVREQIQKITGGKK